jgi:hypothetical protein
LQKSVVGWRRHFHAPYWMRGIMPEIYLLVRCPRAVGKCDDFGAKPCGTPNAAPYEKVISSPLLILLVPR